MNELCLQWVPFWIID